MSEILRKRLINDLEEWQKDLRSLGITLIAFSTVALAYRGGSIPGVLLVLVMGLAGIVLGHWRF